MRSRAWMLCVVPMEAPLTQAAPDTATPGGLLAVAADELQLIAPADGKPVWSAKLGVTSRVTNVLTDETTIYVSWN